MKLFRMKYLSQKLSFGVGSSGLRVDHHLRELHFGLFTFAPVRFLCRRERRVLRTRLKQIRVHRLTGTTLFCTETRLIHSLTNESAERVRTAHLQLLNERARARACQYISRRWRHCGAGSNGWSDVKHHDVICSHQTSIKVWRKPEGQRLKWWMKPALIQSRVGVFGSNEYQWPTVTGIPEHVFKKGLRFIHSLYQLA